MNNKSNRTLSQEDIKNLIAACDNHLKPIIILALNTGMRISGILRLEWNQVNLDRGFISLPSMRWKHTIPLTETAKELLLGLTRNPDIPFVFYNPRTGKPFHDVRQSFHSACMKAKLSNVSFHDLRRTFIYCLYIAGDCNLTALEVFGFRSRSAVERISDISSDIKAKVMAAFDKRMNAEMTA